MALNSVFSFIKMSDRDLKFVYLFCQTDTFLFVIETPIRKCKHPITMERAPAKRGTLKLKYVTEHRNTVDFHTPHVSKIVCV